MDLREEIKINLEISEKLILIFVQLTNREFLEWHVKHEIDGDMVYKAYFTKKGEQKVSAVVNEKIMRLAISGMTVCHQKFNNDLIFTVMGTNGLIIVDTFIERGLFECIKKLYLAAEMSFNTFHNERCFCDKCDNKHIFKN